MERLSGPCCLRRCLGISRRLNTSGGPRPPPPTTACAFPTPNISCARASPAVSHHPPARPPPPHLPAARASSRRLAPLPSAPAFFRRLHIFTPSCPLPLSILLPVHRGCSLIPLLPRGWRFPAPGPGRQSRDRRPVLLLSIISLQSVSYFPPIKSSATNCMGVDRQLMPAKP